MSRMWIVAAVPLSLMALMFGSLWARPSWAETASHLSCLAILAGAFVTGLWVLLVVFVGWRNGGYPLRRTDILAATVLAALDVLIPVAVALLIWLLLQSLRNSRGILMF